MYQPALEAGRAMEIDGELLCIDRLCGAEGRTAGLQRPLTSNGGIPIGRHAPVIII